MWIKICGNTNLEDAALAAELGADAVGFVFAPSKRQVTREQVAAITPHLPPTVERVGVFYSRDPEEIAQTAWHSGLTAIQLHGGLDDNLSERLTERLAGSVRIIQTLHWVVDPPVDATAAAPSGANGQSQPSSSAAHLEQQIIQVAASGIKLTASPIDSKVGLAVAEAPAFPTTGSPPARPSAPPPAASTSSSPEAFAPTTSPAPSPSSNPGASTSPAESKHPPAAKTPPASQPSATTPAIKWVLPSLP